MDARDRSSQGNSLIELEALTCSFNLNCKLNSLWAHKFAQLKNHFMLLHVLPGFQSSDKEEIRHVKMN